MAGIDLDTMLNDLNRRFLAPLPEFYQRRIIFWYDEDREFEDQLDDIQLENAVLLKLTGRNAFEIKKRICFDEKETNFLVYDPLSYDRDDDNWLLNVECYSESFRADLISIWIDEMKLPTTPAIRKLVKAYRKFFNAKDRRAKFSHFSSKIHTAPHVHLAVMAVLCNTEMDPANIIRAVLSADIHFEKNPIYREMKNYGADEAFWTMAAQGTGYQRDQSPSLSDLSAHVILTALTQTLSDEHLFRLEHLISTPHQVFCYECVSDWMHGQNQEAYRKIARLIEDILHLNQRFSHLAIEDLLQTECLPCINEVILFKLMEEIAHQIIDIEKIQHVVEKRRTMMWYDQLDCYYEGLLQIAEMQAFYLEHAAGFHMVEPNKIWEAYTSDYYKMDTYYRRFHLCFQRALKKTNAVLDDQFKLVAEKVEGLYSQWFLKNLGENWTNACSAQLSEFGKILDIPCQKDFYKDHVNHADHRVYVIISDAFRYEVAVNLAEQLQRETQSKVKTESCQAIFPTVTKFGMAALLPHEHLSIAHNANGVISVLADEISTDANNREKILKLKNPASVALQYKNIIGLKSADRRNLVKGMDVVYIYHDKIDEASHTSDESVFTACDDAIDEIKNMVRIIVNEFSGVNVLITSDHGFLYTYDPLKEDDKIGKDSLSDDMVEYGRRYAITGNHAKSEFLLPVRLLDEQSEYKAFTPRENIRIKMSGSGMNYVHGGTSLQEMVVPIIHYQYLRNDSKMYKENQARYDTKPVPLTLLSSGRKISNMIFSLDFYQKEAVGPNREPATYWLYFIDAMGRMISDRNKIIADKSDANGQNRVFRSSFNLRSQKYRNCDSYYLIIEDERGIQPAIREEFQIDIAFAVEDFDFFS